MKISIVQLCSGQQVDRNLETCRRLAEEHISPDIDWILFPENAPFMGPNHEKAEVAETVDGPMVGAFRQMATDFDAWITLGSFPEVSPDDSRPYNTQLLLDPSGEIKAKYRKIHMFDARVNAERSFNESESVNPGNTLVSSPLQTNNQSWEIGLTVCYDLRFPTMYKVLAERGAEVMTVPSAFTRETGRAHWHGLLKARAIENQAYVVAPNQWGHHFGQRYSYGQSVVYDPWGQKIACASDGKRVLTATLDRDYLVGIREKMPTLSHRRVVGADLDD